MAKFNVSLAFAGYNPAELVVFSLAVSKGFDGNPLLTDPPVTAADMATASNTLGDLNEQLGRKWLGCDLDPIYNQLAIERLNRVVRRSPEEWIEIDRNTAMKEGGDTNVKFVQIEDMIFPNCFFSLALHN